MKKNREISDEMDYAKREMFMKRADVTDRNNVHTHIVSTNLSIDSFGLNTSNAECMLKLISSGYFLVPIFNDRQ